MSLGLKDLEVGCVYAQGNSAKELYLYLGKTRGCYNKWIDDEKEGNTFIYVGREFEYDGGSLSYGPLTRDEIIIHAKMMLSFRLGEQISIIKGNKGLERKFSNIKLSEEDVNELCSFGHLTRISKKVRK